MISRSRVRATLLEILGCSVGAPASDTHSSSENSSLSFSNSDLGRIGSNHVYGM